MMHVVSHVVAAMIGGTIGIIAMALLIAGSDAR
jgi:hypothetical protein